MTATEPTDDALDALLRASAPDPLADDDFVARTMTAIDVVTRGMPVPRRATPLAPIAIARALVAERRRHEAQARLWRWAIAGVIAGVVLLALAVLLAPADAAAAALSPSDWLALSMTASVAAVWASWRELRDG